MIVTDLIYRIWNVEDKKQVKIITDALPKSNDFANSRTLADVAWKPDNTSKVLAIAQKTSVIFFQNKDKSHVEWTKIKELKPKKVVIKSDEYINVISFSKYDQGLHLAAGTTKGAIFVWQVITGSTVLETKSTSELEYPICSIDYCPKDTTEAAFIDCNGYWGIVENIPTQNGPNIEKKERNATVAKKPLPSSRDDSERELNEDELAAALFEGKLLPLCFA